MENSKEKQIEEMADILVNGCKMGGCEECKYSEGKFPECELKYTADQLYNLGYRKASEVALEVLDSTKDKLLEYFNNEDKRYNTSVTKSKKQFDIATARYRTISEVVKLVIVDIYAELKKKYTQEN